MGRRNSDMVVRHKLPLDENEDGFPQEEEVLTVNQEFARRFAHNSQRTALHRLQELKKRGVVDSSDESSDDDDDEDEDGLLPARTDLQIFNILKKIKDKDPSIYSTEAKFFDDVDDEQAEDFSGEDERKKKKKKPIYLKDALANQLIEEGPDFQEDIPKIRAVVTYTEEQQALKDEFLSAALSDSDGEEESGLLKVRKKSADVKNEDDDREGSVVADAQQRAKDADIAQRLEEYFGRDDRMDENEKYLKDYLLNKSWIDEDKDRIPSYDEIVGDVKEDEEELEKQDRFEAEYNFRFEEGVGSQVMGHSRSVEGSVRRKDDTRRQSRVKKKDRLSEVALERREELKRLKNIRKREILEKLEKIKDVAGASASELEILQREDLEEDFDPEEYDRKMKEAFGKEYYGAQDADEKFQGHNLDLLEKPDFDYEDELLGLTKDSDEKGKFGFASARERAKELEVTEAGAIFDNNGEDSEDSAEILDSAEGGAPYTNGLSNQKKKGKISLREKLAFDKQLEEYYKLDYEDMIGDLPTRFKYCQVKPNMFGLTTAKIFAAEDKDLNQYVSLKKLAPYVAQEWKPKGKFHVSQKLRKKRALQQQPSTQAAPQANGSNLVRGDSLKDHQESSNAKDGTHPSIGGSEGSKNKKKRRKKGASLSQSRLIAYGRVSLPSKKRKTG